jgi:hypothetical protein
MEGGMGVACVYEEVRNAYRILGIMPEGKRSPGRPGYR